MIAPRAIAWARGAIAAGCLLAAACAPVPSGSPDVTARGSESHDEARWLVEYGGSAFRVNVRYVSLIDESVIAVREGAGEAREEGWPVIRLDPIPTFSRVSNYADDGYRDVVVDIARGVQAEGGVCADGRAIEMSMDSAGEVRTLYRSNRRVWVVFALCPEQVTAEG